MKKPDILIIPDGNRTWARKIGKNYDYGYQQMPKVLGKIINALIKKGYSNLYFWGNSINNLERPKKQIMSFWSHYLEIIKYVEDPTKLKITIKGNKNLFFGGFREKFEELENSTKGNNGLNLEIFLNYYTHDDIKRSIKSIKSLRWSKIMQKMDEPRNIDIVIRTGGHNRLSGFIPIRSEHYDIFFLDKKFPDLTVKDVFKIVDKHNKREITYGK